MSFCFYLFLNSRIYKQKDELGKEKAKSME